MTWGDIEECARNSESAPLSLVNRRLWYVNPSDSWGKPVARAAPSISSFNRDSRNWAHESTEICRYAKDLDRMLDVLGRALEMMGQGGIYPTPGG